MIDTTQFLNGKVTESAAADNAVAVATVGAIAAARIFITGVKADYSAAPTAIFKVIRIKFAGVTVYTISWDPLKGSPLWFGFPGHIHADYNVGITAELDPSGTATVLGRIAVFTYVI